MPRLQQITKDFYDFVSGNVLKDVTEAEAFAQFVNGQHLVIDNGTQQLLYKFDSSLTPTETSTGVIKVTSGGGLVLVSSLAGSATTAEIAKAAGDTNAIGQIYYNTDDNSLYFLDNTTTPVKLEAGTEIGATWGAITGTLANQTDLQAALDLKAPLVSPTFTGTIKLKAVSTAGQVWTAAFADGTGEWETLTKTMVGLGNVDNTSDANKPISTATQTALDLKAPLASPTFTGTVAGITKTMVGLGNVDNTSDANKPISTATQTALDLKAPLASPTFTGTVTIPFANANSYFDSSIDEVKKALENIGLAMNSVGQVKINGRNSVQPTLTLDSSGGSPEQAVFYTGSGALDISASPTTTYPINAPQADASLVDFTNETFYENPVLGQVHIWRFILTYSKSGAATPSIQLRMANDQNPSSSFSIANVITIDNGVTDGEIAFTFITIADSLSIPVSLGGSDANADGYNVYARAFGSDCDITLASLTRVSSPVQPFV